MCGGDWGWCSMTPDDPLQLIATFTRSKNVVSRCRYIMFMLSLMSLVVVIYSTDTPFPSPNERFNNTVGLIMLLTSICGAICAVVLFLQVNSSLRHADMTWRNLRLIDSPYLPFCILEVLVWMVHCPPGVQDVVANPRLLNAFSLLRFYVVVPLFKELSPINQFKARSLTYFSRIRMSASLILRTQLHQSPIITLSVVYCLLAAVLAVFFSLAEGHSFEKSMWFIFISSTTVGYGDTVPTSSGGRVVAAIACIVGLLLVGFIVGAVQQSLSLTDDERAVFNYMELNATHRQLKEDSALVLQRYWRLRKRPTPVATWKLSTAMMAFRANRIQLNLARRAVESQQVPGDESNDVLTAIAELRDKLDELSARIASLSAAHVDQRISKCL